MSMRVVRRTRDAEIPVTHAYLALYRPPLPPHLSPFSLFAAPPPLQGPYDAPSGFTALDAKMSEQEVSMPRANRMFFLSIPPNVFIAAAGGASDHCSSK